MIVNPKLGMWGNLEKLFRERNSQKIEIEGNRNFSEEIKEKTENNQMDTDEMMLDHEERIILLEVGE